MAPFPSSRTGFGLIAAALAVSLLACSSTQSGGSTGGVAISSSPIPPQGPDVDPPSNVTLQPDVVVIHGGAAVMKGISSDHGVWTLDKSASGVSSLAPGKVALIAGVDCARVTAVQDNGSTLDVTVAPVSFTDVLQEASFQWQNQAIDMTKGYIGQLPYQLVVDSEQTPDGGADAGDSGCGAGDSGTAGEAGAGDAGEGGVQCMLHQQGLHLEGLSNPTNSVTVSIGYWTVTWAAATTATGVDITGTLTLSPTMQTAVLPGDPAQTLTGLNVGITFTAHVQNVQGSSGSVTVHGGKITDANISAPIGGSVDLNAQASTAMGGQFPKQAVIKLPLAVEFPLPALAGMPLYLSLQANFLIQPSLAAKNAVIGMNNHVDFTGNAGMKFTSGTATPTSTPNAMTPANPIDNATTPPSVGTNAVIVGMQAPRVGFGIGTGAFGVGAKAGIYVDAVNVFTLTVASSLALVPCQSASWDFASHGGGEMSISVLNSQASISHQVDLYTARDPGSWYSPMVAACKP
jgi:hypothetical protein